MDFLGIAKQLGLSGVVVLAVFYILRQWIDSQKSNSELMLQQMDHQRQEMIAPILESHKAFMAFQTEMVKATIGIQKATEMGFARMDLDHRDQAQKHVTMSEDLNSVKGWIEGRG